jgi:hypothetical protein
MSRLPFLIGFEPHLPRGFGIEKLELFRLMTKRLTCDKCRAIVAISQSARRFCVRMHDGRPCYDELVAKLHVSFSYCVAVRMADLALEQ